jgi:hypothetical protein
MKKPILFFIAIWILFFATSCSVFNLGKKKQSEKETTSKNSEISDVKKDSTNVIFKDKKEVTEKTSPIQKSNSVSLKTADSLTNVKINQALKNFRFYDRSGGNSVSAKYDEKTMQLLIEAFVAGTVNKETNTDSEQKTATNQTSISEKTTEEIIEETSSTVIKMLPWWVWLIGVVYFAPIIIDRVGFLISPLKGLVNNIRK